MKNKLVLALLLFTQLAFGQIPEPQKNTYVNDFAHVLTADQITALNQSIFSLEKQSGVQLAIVLVDKIPAQYDMEEFALLIGRKWHVGKHEDGIVYVAAISQHKQRFEIARALDNTFSNEKSQDILAAIKPYFKQKDYNGGLQELVNQVGATVGTSTQNGDSSQNHAGTPATAQAAQADDPNGTLDFWVGLIAVFGVIALIIYLVRRSNRNRRDRFPPDGFGNGGGYYPGQGMGGSGVGSFVAGAAVGALSGYAAESLIDNLDNNQIQQPDNNTPQDDGSNNDIDQADNTPDNWGNWGSGDDPSSSDSGDSGFSDSDFSSDGGGGSDW